ncbi:MAG: anthranilate phosphoribosyltransferase [Actinomycetales bacterium]|nr:anthranilate phosphoribosyltransferase [Actinomycetales bacterium]
MTNPASPTWPGVLGTLISRADLKPSAAEWAMEEVLSGTATPAQLAAFVTALRAKGESATEVNALVTVMLRHARLLDFGPERAPLALDVVGTGGDQAHTVNISTMSALVCAAAGVPIIKHGNRAASSSTGTADVLERLGVVIDLDPESVVASVRKAGIGFCFAPVHHPAMRHAGPTRRELGVPTVFNILGPLTNPGGAPAALIGCAALPLAPVMADVLHRRGAHALVVRGEDGLDEISTAGPTQVWDATGSAVREDVLDAEQLGVPRTDRELLRGGEAERNADLLRQTLGGDPAAAPDAERVRAIRDAVLVNAAAALAAHRAAVAAAAGEPVDDRPVGERVAEHTGTVREILADGRAMRVLDRWAEVTAGLSR